MNLGADLSLQLEIKNMVENHHKNLNEATRDSALSIIKKEPNHILSWKILGAAYSNIGQINEALVAMQNVVRLNPKDPEAHNNLGVILFRLEKLIEAEKSYKKAIELKPDYAEPYNNLGNTLNESGELDDAIKHYKKAIELKPDYTSAHYRLGLILQQLGKLDEAEKSYKKAIELNPDYAEPLSNLKLILRQKKLLLNISEVNKLFPSIDKKFSISRPILNPFISNRRVEIELINKLYEMSSKELKKIDNLNKDKDARYGNGKCSDFQFLENNYSIIRILTKELTEIMEDAVKSKIYIIDSFFNIYKAGCGTTPHAHIDHFDKTHGIDKKKYSLTYYLDVGDQKSTEPGILKLYDPDDEILPINGTIVIIPADRKHSAIYNGKTDRVMIGVNFYSLQ